MYDIIHFQVLLFLPIVWYQFCVLWNHKFNSGLSLHKNSHVELYLDMSSGIIRSTSVSTVYFPISTSNKYHQEQFYRISNNFYSLQPLRMHIKRIWPSLTIYKYLRILKYITNFWCLYTAFAKFFLEVMELCMPIYLPGC